MTATWAWGTTLTRAGNPIAELTSITGPSHTADTIDVTDLSAASGARKFIAGLKDAGDLSMDGSFYPGDTLGQVAMHADWLAGTERAYVLTFPAAMGANLSFNAFVTAFAVGAPVDGKVPFSATLKLNGVPTLNVTASNNITVLTGIEENAGAALDFVPNFAAGTYTYAVDVINTASTWVKFTATFAAGTCTVWVGGVLIETLVSTVQSGAIAIGAANSVTDITLQVKEANKVATTYVIRIPRP